MDTDTIVTALITSIGGTGVLLAGAFYFGKRLIGTWIDESVKHEYAKELEAHKAQLQEQVNNSLSQQAEEIKETERQRDVDKKLFYELLDALPSDGNIQFLKEGFSGEFKKDEISQIRQFYSSWDTPELTFLDDELEQKRRKLYDVIRDLLDYFSGKYQACPLNYLAIHARIKDSADYGVVINELNKRADNVIAAHEDLIIAARTKLKC